MGNLAIVIVGTGKYSFYAAGLIKSILELNMSDVQIHLFTDNCPRLARLPFNNIFVHTVYYEEWPAATLNRFKYIISIKEKISASHIMYIDADSLAAKNFFEEVTASKKITFVEHPGFYRNYPMIIKRIRSMFDHAGTWEKRSGQMSFISRFSRRPYTCGGTWFGPANEVVRMCEIILDRILQDQQMKQIPLWHDQSHTNWYCANFKSDIQSPKFAFVSYYPNLRKISPLIYVLEKPIHWTK